MPPKKQPPQQYLEEEEDALVTSKQFQEMMHMMEPLTTSMNETFNKTTISLNEMFHKSQASIETTLEWVQRGIAALETWLPIAATDLNVAANPNAAAANTHVDSDSFTEDLGVNNDEHSELLDPPPRPRQSFNRQGMEVINITTTNTMARMMLRLI
jgi:beta-galactosidase GanA